MLKFLKKFNFSLVLPAFFLSCLGLLSLYSSSLFKENFLNFKKQIIFLFFSLGLVIFLHFFDLRFLRTNSYFLLLLYFFSLFFLFGLTFFGQEIRGVKGWYKLGAFSFDPVPFSAIILILILSKYFSTRHVETKRFQPILFSALYAFLPVLLVLLQPDIGSSLGLISIWLGIIIFSGIRFKYFLILALIFLILIGIGWQFFLKEYQRQRILTFLNPEIDPQGSAWNINQAKIAIGAGGFLGQGIGKGSQTQYGFLPEPQTDFIFAALAEEIGFLGVLVLIFLFSFLFWQIMKITLSPFDNFTRLFAAGFAFLLFTQSFINIGMNLGLLPIIGLPLPFVSYGGSQLLSFYLGLGILTSLAKSRR